MESYLGSTLRRIKKTDLEITIQLTHFRKQLFYCRAKALFASTIKPLQCLLTTNICNLQRHKLYF